MYFNLKKPCIAERLGLYDRFILDMDSPVFDDLDQFVEHHS